MVGALVAVVCFYFGADVWWSLAFGFAVIVAGVALRAGPEPPEVDWPSAGAVDRVGTRSDIVELSESLRGGGRVGAAAMGRLQQLAQQRLARHRLDLLNPADQPGIERLVGQAGYRLLTSAQGGGMSRRSFVQCLDLLDALDPSPRLTQPDRVGPARADHGGRGGRP